MKPKAILLIEKWDSPAPLLEKIKSTGVDQKVDLKLLFSKDGHFEDLRPWGDHSHEVSHIVTKWGSLKNIQAICQHSPNIKWVHALTAGLDRLVGPELEAMNITLTNSKGALSEAMAEFVMFQMLWFTKKGLHYVKAKTEGKWLPEECTKLSGKTLGIIGYGDIGGQCGLKAKKGFQMRVLGVKNDPSRCEDLYRQAADEIVGFDQIDRVMAESDFVLASLPLTPGTTGLINYELLKKMKPTAVFMNVGRGKNVVEKDLVQALKEKVIAGAYLDVFEVEPLPSDSELWKLENVFIAAHSSDLTDEIMEDVTDTYHEHLDLFIEGNPLKNVIDMKKGY